ncbi:MAG: DEAD/DEAH box helicase [Marmoricola sp.]
MSTHPVDARYASFVAGLSFTPDRFQAQACAELAAGHSVLVAAPTGSGKTLVGEFAVHVALDSGRKAFYTTPIKALSNQKFHELQVKYGADRVGLLTGDNAINGDAPVIVMTTEVLRNMLYEGSRALSGLAFVVMDEVHYLADRSRGAVWEEVIIHLPESVAIVALSATVSNAEEFGDWLATVRGSTRTILEETRPVPLYQHVVVGKRMYDLFDGDALPTNRHESPKVNPELLRVARDDWASRQMRDRRSPKGSGGKGQRNVGNGRRVWIPSRTDVVDQLDRAGLLPAIVFIFSRAGCDAAVQQCLHSNLRLTTPAEAKEIQRYVAEHCSHLPDEDLDVLGYAQFAEALSRGIAAHHAGMLPAFKECVEELFVRGMCRVVFATETLALGINMPARSVVIEKLTKWNGDTHADITPGEYTQLTGRAGRRGIDVEGHAVVLWQPGVDPKEVAGLASTRTYPLRSSFQPTYNMAVNLVHQFGRERARTLLESSFAQFQADRAVVGLAAQLGKSDDALEGYAEAATCDRGDFMEYARIRRELSDVESREVKQRREQGRAEVSMSLERLRPGDIIQVPSGRYAGYALVLDSGGRGDREGPRPFVLTVDRQARRLSIVDFSEPVESLGVLRIPKGFSARNPQARRDLVSTLRARTHGFAPPRPSARASKPVRDTITQARIDDLRAALRAHPCHDCPDREDHARWAERWFKLERDAAVLRKRIEQRTNSIARRFDRVCEVLAELGYLAGEEVTDRGRLLMGIYSELDLVVAECLRRDLWADLDASGLAAVLSTLVFESRRGDDGDPPRLPKAAAGEAIAHMHRLARELDQVERSHGLESARGLDVGLSWAAYRWAEGDELEDVLDACGLAAGDFVRSIKQVLDLAGQVADAAAGTPLATVARATNAQLRRGVVAYSTVLE